MADEPSRGSGQFILNSPFAIRYSLFPHPSPAHRFAMDGAPAQSGGRHDEPYGPRGGR